MDACSQGGKNAGEVEKGRSLDPWGSKWCSLVEKVYGEIGRNEEQKRAQVFQGSESATQFSDWTVWPGWDWLALKRAGHR